MKNKKTMMNMDDIYQQNKFNMAINDISYRFDNIDYIFEEYKDYYYLCCHDRDGDSYVIEFTYDELYRFFEDNKNSRYKLYVHIRKEFLKRMRKKYSVIWKWR